MMKKIINKICLLFGCKIISIEESNTKTNENIDWPVYLNGNPNSPFDTVPFAGETLEHLLKNYDFDTVLDIGSGEGKHSDVFKSFNKNVVSIDYGKSVYFERRDEKHTCLFGDYYSYEFDNQFDAIWASHVLEHQPNPNLFLKKVNKDLKEGGVLAVTVPPLKEEIVGGHVTLWNAGLLLYQLILAGFNCKNVSIKTYGYNISIILEKKSIKQLPELSFDKGDILKLKPYFPDFITEPFNGQIAEHNWKHD